MLRNPRFYFVAIPAFLLLWPFSLWTIYLPQAKKNWTKQKSQYNEIQTKITEILRVDPERLDFANTKTDKNEFDYASAINRVAGSCSINSQHYTLSSSAKASSSKGETTQSASVALKDVSITQFAKFISTIQIRWANLQCKSIKLTQRKGPKDKWDIKLEFQYFF